MTIVGMEEYNLVRILLRTASVAYSPYPTEGTTRITCPREDSCVDIALMGAETLIISFRGSESWRDALTDASRRMVQWHLRADIYLHRGFLRHYQSIHNELCAYIKASGRRRLLVTGHSLGGALATLCTLELGYSNPDWYVCAYTFNAPRVGNVAFVRLLESLRNCHLCRVISDYDYAHRFPCIGYHHTSRVISVGVGSFSVFNPLRVIRYHSINTLCQNTRRRQNMCIRPPDSVLECPVDHAG